MKMWRKRGLLAGSCLLVVTTWATAQTRLNDRYVSVPPEVATEGLTAIQSLQLQENIAQWLAAQRPELGAPIMVRITPGEMENIEVPEVTNAAPLKVGVVVPMGEALRLGALVNTKGQVDPKLLAGGGLVRGDDGSYNWAVGIGSERAGGVRLHIENMFLPDNASLYFYSDAGEVNGPFTGTGPDSTGEFWTPSVMGDQGILQLRLEPGATKDDLLSVSLTVTEVGHVSRSFFGIMDEGSAAAFCSFNASCIVNNNCQSNSAVNNAELADAKMLWVQGAFIYTCSGALIADSDSGTQIPYFMTAGHCLSQSNSGLEAFFHYEVSCGTSTCTGTYTDPPTSLISGKTVGATVRAQGSISSGDYCLLELSQNPPAGSVFLGWTNAPIANTNGAALHRISHPTGAPQAYSNANVNTSAPTCQGWNRGPLIYSTGNVGATEGGSSGSATVNASGQFVGQLTGSCGTNLNNVCDHGSNATVDGAFAFYYNAVAPFLAGGGGCQPVGSTCSSNSQCCSNKCRGGRCR